MSRALEAAAYTVLSLTAYVIIVVVLNEAPTFFRKLRDRLQWTRALRDVIRTDSQMFSNAFRLSLAHFQAVKELRKLGGRR